MQAPDWNTFSQHIGKLASAQINNLKTLTRDHLNAGNNEKKAHYLKVAYVDSYDGQIFYDTQGAKIVPPRVVLWEVHPEVQGLNVNWNNQPTNVDALKKSLRTQYLPPDLQSLKTEIYFASMLLRDQKVHSEPETLRHYLLSYCDKIYAKPLPLQFNTTWTQYKTYFNQAQEMILTNPTLYSELCRKLKELFLSQSSPNMSISEDKLYSYLIMLRNLPETVARANTGHIEAAISIKELIALLDILDEDETAVAREITYNVINAIEWLTYLIPKMYGALPSNNTSSSLYEELVERLEKYIIGEKYKLAIRMEAAWALGWASVSSIGIATYVHQYEKSTQSRVDRIHSNVLRHVVSTAYLRAAFTLVSFGPARVASSMVEPLPGAYLPDQIPAQVNPSIHDYARRAAANIVYGELKQMVRWDILTRLRFATLAASWLVINDLISIFFSLKFIVVIWLAITPILILLINVIYLTWRWGKGYQWQIIIAWAMFILLTVSPWISLVSWQQAFIIAGAFIAFLTAIFGIVSSWLSVFAVFLGLVRFLRTKVKP